MRNKRNSIKKDKKNKKDALYHTLLNRILFLEYRPRHILKEEELALEFGVSRGPVREVLKRLEWEQLVETMPRTGTVITEIEYVKIIQVFQIRLIVETLAGQSAAENITDSQLSRIKEIREEVAKLLNQQVDRKKLVTLNMMFRDILYEAVGNPVLKQISKYLYHQTVRFHSTLFHTCDWLNYVQTFLDTVDKTYECLLKKDPEETGMVRGARLKEYLERLKTTINEV